MYVNLYFVVAQNFNGKYRATVHKVSKSLNLYEYFKNIPCLDIIHCCDTEKHANEICKNWNETWAYDGKLTELL